MRAQYLDWPHEVSVETFAKCNAACTFCPYTTLERIGTRMPDEMIERIVRELKDHPHPFFFAPFKVNEPFLDKRTLPLCRMVNAVLPKAVLRIFSNGSTLTADNIAGVAGLKRVAHLWVSLNDCDETRYRALMGLDFNRTVANLDGLHEAKRKGFPHPVVVSKVADGLLDDEFKAYVRDRWPLFGVQIIKRDGWLGHVEPGSPEIPDAACGRWFELSITATGKVALCCMDGEAKYAIGDLNEQSLFEVYNSRTWRDRRLHLVSRKTLHPCDTCTY